MKKTIWAIIAVAAASIIGYTAVNNSDGGDIRQALIAESCSPASQDYAVRVLGYLEAQDEVQNLAYGFIVCQIKDLTKSENNFEIKIASNWLTGTSLTPARAAELAAQAQTEGKEYFTWGEPYVPTGDLDAKRVEYRFYQRGGQPTKIEVFVVLRHSDRSAKEPQTLSLDWPAVN